MSNIKIKNSNGQWVENTKAINTKLMDLEGNFESKNVEGALRELAQKNKSRSNAALELQVQKINITLYDHEERIKYLEETGGGGSIVPTIKSDFKDCAIEKGQDITIPLFFSSSSGGNGTAYVIVNNMEVDYVTVKQGTNNIKVLSKHLTQTENKISIYVKDRAGLVSNQLEWSIIAGGITVTTSFDYEVDYGITDTIIMPYNIETGITGDVILHLTVDGVSYEIPSKNGYNQLDMSTYVNTLGTHSISMYATVDKYVSKEISFNLVITSTTELYLSTTFVDNAEYTYAVPISINYRLSKKSTELFDVYIFLDDVLQKTQELTVGSYYWTLSKAPIGEHKVTIRAISKDQSENKSIDMYFKVVKGVYTPLEDITEDLQLDLNAVGKSNNDNNNGLWLDDSGNNRHAEMINFNFSTNGFINDTVVCDNNAYIKIPYSPWEANAKKGSTIDLIYTPINSGNEEARVIDYTFTTDDMAEGEIKPFKGVFADIRQAIISSASSGINTGNITLDENSGEIHLTWVIDRENKFCKTYINGVLSRIMFLTDSGSGNNATYEDFAHNEFIYLNSTKGENCGTYDIKRLRVWGHALTSDEVLKTHIANIKDLEKQEELYNFNYNNSTLPRMDLWGDITNMTPYQTVDMRIQYTSPNEELYGPSFNTGIQNNPVKIQGTSSLQYARHNYTIYLKDEFGSPFMYNPYGEKNAMPDSVFCLKADYIESSHGNNTGMANFVNDNVYDTKLPPQLENPAMRTTIAGFPIIVYMNGEYLGVYNFNHDRYSTESYGYDYKKYPNMLVYEINSNSNTSAGAFYRWGDNEESSANINERDYYARDFNLIYGNRTSDSDTYAEIKTLVEWVSVAEQDLFRETISEHFNKEYLFRYLLTVLMIGGVDSLGKNLKITTFDGKVWYPTFYDLDTCLGIDNSGYLTIQPDVEIEEGSFNTSNSNLWTKVMNYFANELKEEWALMRQGRFTLDNLMKYVIENQIEVIPAKYYNDDAQVKYIAFGSKYTYCCHGNKELLVKRWLRERIAYVDSMMGYFTSQDDQVTIRMNKTGYVEFTVTPYIPLYFSVKWSNAEGGTQTFKLKRGETKTFYYTSTTATDQEVIIYHAQYIKELGNLSNLRPSSCILANAYKLNNVEIHSEKLYNVNVTANKYLRKLDLSGCSTLGTVTATGSVLDVSNCKYLSYLNVYGTALTGVLLNTNGGSLKEIYYPKTIQEVQLINQTLLEMVGLPYGKNGEEIPTSLYSVDIQECPNIKTLNTSTNSEINKTWISMKYCQNLTIRNALDFETITLDGFQRLKVLKLENMFKLKALGFDDMLPVGGSSTLQYMGVSYCPELTDITMNCTSDDYEITFADGALLNLNGATSLKSLSSNCVIKGLETIVLPLTVKHLYFTNEYGTGYSSIKNIWSSRCCEINEEGVLPIAIRYEDKEFIGMDLQGMKLNDIDLGALVNIPAAINFDLAPTSVNPNFNINRDGVEYPYLQPQGILDLTNYTESLARFFNGIDLDKLQIVCDGTLPQTDLSYCFYNSTFTSDDRIVAILNNIGTVNNMEYCFYKTSVKDVSILNNINFLNGTSLAYCFAECANLSKLQDIVLNENIGNAEYMFSGSGLAAIKNVTTSCRNIKGMFSNCNNLVDVTNFNANGTTSYESLFEGCNGMSVAPIIVIPNNITNISRMYKDCLGLVSIDGFVLHGNITVVDDFIAGCDNLINANNITISGPFYNDIFRGITSIKYVNNLLINYVGRSMTFANMFDGCTNLIEMSFHDDSYVKDVISMDYMFRGTSMKTVDFSNVNFEKIVSYKYMFADCLMEEFSYTVPETIISIEGFLSGCRNLKTLRAFHIDTNVSTNKWIDNTSIENLIDCRFNTQFTKFENYTSLKNVENLTYTGKDFSNYFNGCSNLKTASINITSATNKIVDTFANCPNLTSVDFLESDLSSVTNVTGIFNGDTSLTTINNWRITNPSTVATNETLVGCPINNTDGLYINSNSVMEMFRMKENSNIVRFTDFELGSSANNLQGLFEKYPSLTHDISLPSHVANVSSLFKNCLNLEYIQSNWSNSYDLNNDYDLSNDVITEECYDGCTNVRYIDNELYMNEYGELTAIYNIPEEWGGIMNYADDETVFDVNTKYMNDRTITLQGNSGAYVTNWGDGTTDKLNSHTYTKEGTFRVVTKNAVTFGQGTVVDTALSLCITKFLHLNKNLTNGSHLFDGWSNLLKIYQLENTFNSYDYMFNNCTRLMDVDLSNCTLSQTVTSVAYMCNGCANLTKTPISVIPDTCINISYLFANSGITDISELTFGSGISSFTSWIPPKVITANNITIKNNNVNFDGCNTLMEARNLTITNTVTSLEGFLGSCTNLTNFSFNKDSDLSKVTTIKRFLVGNKIISTLDFSEFDLTSLDTMSATGENQGFIANTNVSYVDFSNCEFGNKKINWIWLTNNCKTQESITFDFTNTIMPVINFNRFGWGSGNTEHYFKFNGADFKYWTTFARMFATDATHINGVDFTDAKFSHITNFSDMFNATGLSQGNFIHITEDIVFPSTATNVERAFYGCTKLTHVHSNWNNTYTNGITATDCYSGCTAITHIDGENVIAYDGDLGTDYIPLDWGGNGFTLDCTIIYELNITEQFLNTPVKPIGTPSLLALDASVAKINWGDGSPAELLCVNNKITEHTYATAGTYFVKAHASMGHGYGAGFAGAISKLLQVPKYEKGRINNLLQFACSAASNMTYADFSNLAYEKGVTKFKLGGMFLNCNSLKTVIIPSDWIVEECSSIFNNCSSLESVDFIKDWDISNCTSTQNMFANCSSLTSLDLSNWNVSKVTNMSAMFQGCSSLTYLNANNWDLRKVTNLNNTFSNCIKLEKIDGTSGWNLSSANQLGLTFYSCSSLKEIDVTNWNCGNSSNGVFQGCTSLERVIGSENLVNSKWTNCHSMFRNCEKLIELKADNWDLSNVTSLGFAFSSCYKLEKIFGIENLITSTIKEQVLTFASCYKLKMDFMYDGIGKPNWEFTNLSTWLQTFNNCGRDVEIQNGTTTILDLRDCGTMRSTNFLYTFYNMNANIIYVDVNTANGTATLDHRNTFTSPNLKELYVTGVWGGDLRSIVSNSPNLTTVDFSNLDFSNIVTDGWGPISGATNVENFKMGTGYSASLSFSTNPKLTKESLLSILNNLPQVSSTKTLTLGSINLAKLSSSDITIATGKNWTVV